MPESFVGVLSALTTSIGMMWPMTMAMAATTRMRLLVELAVVLKWMMSDDGDGDDADDDDGDDDDDE